MLYIHMKGVAAPGTSLPIGQQAIEFDRLFNPRAIAIIGVNKAPYGGTYFLKILAENEFPNPIYPVNPKLEGDKVLGYDVFGTIDSIPDDVPIDLGIVAVPARITPEIITQLGMKEIPFAHIFSSGFSEVGNEGIEKELLEVSAKYNCRIVGPNCVGVYNPRSRVSFASGASLKPGAVAMISQSGGLAIRAVLNGPSRGYHFSKAVSVGNQIDLDIVDFLEYLANDDETQIISIYLENIKKKGREFIRVLGDISGKKPVIIWKAGAGETGKQAVMSHTGGLAGDYRIWEGLCKQTGAILVDNFMAFTQTVQALSYYPVPETKEVAIITAGGGLSVEGTDACERNGLCVPRLSKEGQDRMHDFVPVVNTNVKNPFDLGAIGLNTKSYAQTINVLKKELGKVSILFVKDPEKFGDYARAYKVDNYEDQFIQNLVAEIPGDRIIAHVPAFLREDEHSVKARHQFRVKLQEHGIMSFESFDDAAACISRMWHYSQRAGKKEES